MADRQNTLDEIYPVRESLRTIHEGLRNSHLGLRVLEPELQNLREAVIEIDHLVSQVIKEAFGEQLDENLGFCSSTSRESMMRRCYRYSRVWKVF